MGATESKLSEPCTTNTRTPIDLPQELRLQEDTASSPFVTFRYGDRIRSLKIYRPPDTNFTTLRLQGDDNDDPPCVKYHHKIYHLKSIHIKVPSEHSFGNIQYPMELQLNHISKEGEHLGVAFMVKVADCRGTQHLERKDMLRQLLQDVQDESECEARLGSLISKTHTGFYFYEGSTQRSRHCFQSRWIVFSRPIGMPQDAISDYVDSLLHGKVAPPVRQHRPMEHQPVTHSHKVAHENDSLPADAPVGDSCNPLDPLSTDSEEGGEVREDEVDREATSILNHMLDQLPPSCSAPPTADQNAELQDGYATDQEDDNNPAAPAAPATPIDHELNSILRMIDSAAAAPPASPAPLPSGNKEQEDQEEDDDLRQDLESVLSQGASPPAAAPEEAQAPDAAEAEPPQAEDKKTQQEAIQKLQDLFPSQGSASGGSDSAIKGVQEQLKAFIDGKLQGVGGGGGTKSVEEQEQILSTNVSTSFQQLILTNLPGGKPVNTKNVVNYLNNNNISHSTMVLFKKGDNYRVARYRKTKNTWSVSRMEDETGNVNWKVYIVDNHLKFFTDSGIQNVLKKSKKEVQEEILRTNVSPDFQQLILTKLPGSKPVTSENVVEHLTTNTTIDKKTMVLFLEGDNYRVARWIGDTPEKSGWVVTYMEVTPTIPWDTCSFEKTNQSGLSSETKFLMFIVDDGTNRYVDVGTKNIYILSGDE